MEPLKSNQPLRVGESSVDDPRLVHVEIATRIADLQERRRERHAQRTAAPRPSIRLAQKLVSAARFLFS